MNRQAWQNARQAAIARQRGACHRCFGKPTLFDVLRTKAGVFAFCRSCRLKTDAPTRIAKAVRTRKLLAAQLQLGFPLRENAA